MIDRDVPLIHIEYKTSLGYYLSILVTSLPILFFILVCVFGIMAGGAAFLIMTVSILFCGIFFWILTLLLYKPDIDIYADKVRIGSTFHDVSDIEFEIKGAPGAPLTLCFIKKGKRNVETFVWSTRFSPLLVQVDPDEFKKIYKNLKKGIVPDFKPDFTKYVKEGSLLYICALVAIFFGIFPFVMFIVLTNL